MPHTKYLLLAFAALMTACSSLPLQTLKEPPKDARAQVLVFRENAMAASLVSLTVGVNGQAFAMLGNDDKVSVALPPGPADVFVQARSAEPTRVRVDLAHGSTVCLRTSANPSAFAKALVPIALMTKGYHFYLDQVPCPAEDVLSRYKSVPVAYE